MSKLATIKQYQYSPAAGGGILGGVAKFVGGALKKVFPSLTRAGQAVMTAAKTPAGQALVGTAAGYWMMDALTGQPKFVKGRGASGGWHRRARGITARELRGYRKVANLLHKEGMVSRRARRGK